MVSGSDKWGLMVSRVWPGFGRSEKETGLHAISSSQFRELIPITYCNPSTPFTGFESVFSDFPIFEIEGDTKSALRFAEPLLFGVFALGVNPSNLVQ